METFKIIKKPPSPEDYKVLRREAGLSPRDLAGIKRGLSNSWFGVHITNGSETVAMGRIVGDDGTAFQVVDIAVLPQYQGRGLGKAVMEELMRYYEEKAPASAYLSLIADGDARYLYEKYGFKVTAPASVGMSFRRKQKD